MDDDTLDDSRLLTAPPPRHLTVESSIDGLWPVTTVTYRRLNPQAFFLVPFTCAWAGGSLWMLYGRQIAERSFNPQLTLFGIPFLFGSIALIGRCLFLLFGKTILSLSGGNGRCFSGIGPFGKTIRFKYGRTSTFEGRRAIIIRNERDSNSVCICSGFSDDALRYTSAILRRESSRV